MIGKTISHYRVIGELGHGSMGVVYRAEDVRLGRYVALKFLPPEASTDRDALDRFQREARAASALNHPHICTIHDIGEVDGQPFIVMELIEGEPLSRRIAGRPFEVEGVIDVAMQIAEALDAAHARSIVHRDIKPANMMISPAGQVKILDFGLAKLVDEHKREPRSSDEQQPTVLALDARMTSPGQTMGTTAYMSPEQVRGEDLDARTDIFSLGVVIYEMATGRLPFQGATAGVIFDAILNRPAPPPTSVNRTLPAELDGILAKALEKDRDLRYQSAREVRADLARLRRDSSASRVTAASVAVAARPRRRRGLLTAAAVAVLLAAGGTYWFWLQRAAPAERTGPAALARITFDGNLQTGPSWSPDGRFLAYASDQSGNFDIWVQPLGGAGRAVQITSDPASDWSPAWSPDGNSIAFRSEREGGGIFIAPALGGRERKVSDVGYWPAWSPDGSRLFFEVRPLTAGVSRVIPHVYTVPVGGGAPTRILEAEFAKFQSVRKLAWHPDGRHVTFFANTDQEAGFWNLSIAGGEAVLAPIADDVAARIKEAGLTLVTCVWAPRGDAVYIAGIASGVQNLWRIGVDPDTLGWVSGPDRLTTGTGSDADVAVSSDGKRLAFVTRTETSRLWSVPFDAASRRLTGEPQPLTSANAIVQAFDLTADGRTLVYVARRAGRAGTELWAKSLEDSKDRLVAEGNGHFAPRVAPDGSAVAYRLDVVPGPPIQRRLMWLALGGGEEQMFPEGHFNPWSWSPDGRRLIHNCPPPAALASLCSSVVVSGAAADMTTIVADPEYSLWQGRFSPDGRWVAFNAQSLKEPGVSLIGVVPASGGKWAPLTARRLWSDKPRWASDGRTVYFVSNRGGAFFDVWGIQVDPATGAAIGEEFRVTRFDSPGLTLSAAALAELGVGARRLLVPLTEPTGSVWTLDNVAR